MKRKCILAAVLFFGLLLNACSPIGRTGETGAHGQQQSNGNQQQQAGKDASNQKEVMLVYMVGSNLESEAGLASQDIQEMLGCKYDEDAVEILVCTGGASYWWIDGIPNDACTVYEAEQGSLNQVYTLKGENMGEQNTLTEFLNFSYANYQADYYSLVFWDHGGGAVLGYGADENFDYDALSVSELDAALAHSDYCQAGKKFEWVGYDACLMGMLEVAEMMTPYSNYLIASEEVEAGDGWNYEFLSDMTAGNQYNGADTAKCIIDSYGEYYEENYSYAPDYTLSCLDLSKTNDVVEKLNSFVEAAEGELQKGGYSKIARMRDETKSFGNVSNTSFYDTVDLYDFADHMKKMYPDETIELQDALGEFVAYNSSNLPNAHGVAVYFPYENKEYVEDWLTEYSNTGFSETYTSFVKDFAATLSGEPLANWSIADTTPMQSNEQAGQYYIQLAEDQLANYSHGSYSLWQEDSEGTYICWINSRDVSLSEDGKLSSGFDGRQYFLGDTSGNSLQCCALEIDRTDEYTKYAIPIMINPEGSMSMNGAYIHMRVDAEHPDGVIIGVYDMMDTDSTLFPEKDMVEIHSGDCVFPFYFARDIIFNEDGSVAPFDDWKASSGTGESFKVTGDLTLTMKMPEENQDYCCLFSVTDTQGNSSYTNPVYINNSGEQ